MYWQDGSTRQSYQGWYDPVRLRHDLKPLIDRLDALDRARVRLEQHGGDRTAMATLARLLSQPVFVAGDKEKVSLALVEPSTLALRLRGIDSGLKLQVRKSPASGMPIYYFARACVEWWDDAKLIVEDYHLGQDYPMVDPRFALLMDQGREVYFRRLSPFRGAAGRLAGTDPWALDVLLQRAGRAVFRAAWDEDQRPAAEVARHLGYTQFSRAIELIYLVLSGDLSALRHQGLQLAPFFREAYPQPALAAFLERLSSLDGDELAELPKLGLPHYTRLLGAFGRFLKVEVPWGRLGGALPLAKVAFSNFGRLALVARRIGALPAVQAAGRTLEAAARQAIEELAGADGIEGTPAA